MDGGNVAIVEIIIACDLNGKLHVYDVFSAWNQNIVKTQVYTYEFD